MSRFCSSYKSSTTFVADVAQAPSAGVLIVASVAGDVALQLQDGSTVVISAAVGTSEIYELAATTLLSEGTTATAVVSALRK